MVSLLHFFRRYREIFRRIAYTLVFLFIFRMGALITIPGITLNDLDGASENQFIGLLSMLGGGILNRVSLFAIGISPFITASIIVQLLSTGLIPPMAKLLKQGTRGQRKLNLITKIIMIPIGYLQALGTLQALASSGIITANWSLFGSYQDAVFYYFFCPLMLLAGTMITLFIAHLINQKGIGQGTSIIIFTGILVSMPQNFELAIRRLFTDPGISADLYFTNAVRFIYYILAILLLIILIIFLNNSERRIPIQQTGVGLRLQTEQHSYLPVKVNPAGVIPVIFSSTLISIFNSVADLINQPDHGYVRFVNNYLSLSTWFGIVVFGLLTFLFVLLYARISFNTHNLATNFEKNGTYIIGIKPGPATERYLNRVLNRLSFFGGFYLLFLAIFSLVFSKFVFPNQSTNFVLSGTSLLILIMIGQGIIQQLLNFRTQLYYINLRSAQQKDRFLW